MLASTLVFSSSAATKKALPLSVGLETLRSKFESGVGGEENGYAIDYCYYSPVGKLDNNKYPVVIYLHGIGHGKKPGSQLDDSTMVTWASQELQSRWKDAGGAFILLPRCPENKFEYWSSALVDPLRRMIDDFIAEHREHVDPTRIFIGGSSAGGEMTWNMITEYPQYFAGAFPMAATGTRTEIDAEIVQDVAVWMFASKLDPLVNYLINVEPCWKKVCKYSSAPENCRLSSFGMVCNPDGSIAGENHRLFQTIMYDFFTIDNKAYPNVETVDGNGKTVNMNFPNGMISWMSGIHSEFDGAGSTGGGPTNIFSRIIIIIRNIFFKIANIFQRILGFV